MEQTKLPGDWHVVVFKRAGFSALRSKGSFPMPEVGTRCVCCDAETATRMRFDPSAGRSSASSLELPRCDECAPHVAINNNRAVILLAFLCVGILVLAVGATNSTPVAVIGALILFAGLAYHLTGVKQLATMAKKGHHNGLEIAALPDLLSFRTTNPRLAGELRERNPELAQPRQ